MNYLKDTNQNSDLQLSNHKNLYLQFNRNLKSYLIKENEESNLLCKPEILKH